jgi:hypothetical protein
MPYKRHAESRITNTPMSSEHGAAYFPNLPLQFRHPFSYLALAVHPLIPALLATL